MTQHAKQLSIVVRLGRIRRMHDSIVFERQIGQTEINADEGDDTQIASLNR